MSAFDRQDALNKIQRRLAKFARELAEFRGRYGRDQLRKMHCGPELDALDAAFMSRKET